MPLGSAGRALGPLDGVTPPVARTGTLRARAIAGTLAAVRPLMAAHGITRCADVTGLDRLGIPVTVVARPNGRTLSVSQGKGADLDAARVSGIMESIETDVAERAHPPVRTAPRRELLAEGEALDAAALPHPPWRRVDDATVLPWVEGMDPLTRRPVWLPLERVLLDGTRPLRPGLGLLVQDSNGLASGNVPVEALLHGLLELVERDARALALERGRAGRRPRRIETGALGAVARAMVESCHQAGVEVVLLDIGSDLGVPVVEGILVDRGTARLPPLRPMHGHGCHLDPELAVVRAIAEAAQCRLTVISGAREDLDPGLWDQAPPPAFGRPAGGLPGTAVPPAETLEGSVRRLLARLTALGCGPAAAVDLSPVHEPLAVVRVLVPGLEGYAGSVGYVRGRRAAAAAAGVVE